MNRAIESRTALLATALGASLFTAGAMAERAGALDTRTARELAVLSRVLEKRLGEMRASIADAAHRVAPSRPHDGGGLR